MLNEMQKDILIELVNVYVGEAARILAEMTNQAVDLNVPAVLIIAADDNGFNIFPTDSVFSQGHIISAAISFSQGLQGKAFLLFPEKQAKILVKSCMDEVGYQNCHKKSSEIFDVDFDVLNELANIILNSIIGGFANLLGRYLEYSIPEVELIYVNETEEKLLLDKQTNMLVLRTFFTLADRVVHGAILITLSSGSMDHLIDKINAVIKGLDN